MTTATHDVVERGPGGLILACAWCVPKDRLSALNAAYPGQVSHALCPDCQQRLLADVERRTA